MDTPEAITISQLNRRIVQLVASDHTLQQVWVVGETSDLRMAGGHCYLELVDKDSSGKPVAKIRANIWASAFYRLAAKFMHATGEQLRSDLKVMVLGSATFHPLYGLSLNITDINAAYTLGEVMQRRAEMIRMLKAEGIIDMNRQLPWGGVPLRVAVISAPGAAGYGDFIKHLYSNPCRLRFTTRLFPAVMQGERTAPSVIAALEDIAAESDSWDCVVIIRGGGATTDLLSFDDYDLAANIAQYPLPVITGIGHDRDRTVLGYVAKVDVKTPTDAAQVLITLGEQALGRLHEVASAMLRSVSDRLSGCHQQLAYIAGALPAAATGTLERAKARTHTARMALASVGDRRLRPEAMRLSAAASALRQAATVALGRQRERLQSQQQLLEVLSPQATLRRGYSITRCNGRALTSAHGVPPGMMMETILADGRITSITLGSNA